MEIDPTRMCQLLVGCLRLILLVSIRPVGTPSRRPSRRLRSVRDAEQGQTSVGGALDRSAGIRPAGERAELEEAPWVQLLWDARERPPPAVGNGNSAITPSGAIRPILFTVNSVNYHRDLPRFRKGSCPRSAVRPP